MASLGDNMTAAGGARDVRRLPAAGQAGVRRRRAADARLADAGELDQPRAAAAAGLLLLHPRLRVLGKRPPIVSVPSGNFGNLTAGLIAKRLGLPGAAIRRGDQCQRRRARVPAHRAYTSRGRRCGRWPTPWTSARRATSSGCRRCTATTSRRCAATSSAARIDDARVVAEIGDVYRASRLPAGSAQRDRVAGAAGGAGRRSPTRRACFWRRRIPAKFREVVEPAIGRPVPLPRPLQEALGRPRHSVSMDVDYAALREFLHSSRSGTPIRRYATTSCLHSIRSALNPAIFRPATTFPRATPGI